MGRNNSLKPQTTLVSADGQKTFSFVKEDVRKKTRVVEAVKDESTSKHGSLICLKNVKKEEASSISREPVAKQRKNSHQSTKSKKSQSPTPKQIRFELKNQGAPVATDLAGQSTTTGERRLKLQTKEQAQSYAIPVHSGFHTVKSGANQGAPKKSFSIKPSQTTAASKNVAKQSPPQRKSQSPKIKKMLVEIKDEKDYQLMCQMVAEMLPNPDQSRQESRQKELEREKSKERVKETLQNLQERLDDFGKISDQHKTFINQLAYLQH